MIDATLKKEAAIDGLTLLTGRGTGSQNLSFVDSIEWIDELVARRDITRVIFAADVSRQLSGHSVGVV